MGKRQSERERQGDKDGERQRGREGEKLKSQFTRAVSDLTKHPERIGKLPSKQDAINTVDNSYLS